MAWVCLTLSSCVPGEQSPVFAGELAQPLQCCAAAHLNVWPTKHTEGRCVPLSVRAPIGDDQSDSVVLSGWKQPIPGVLQRFSGKRAASHPLQFLDSSVQEDRQAKVKARVRVPVGPGPL